MAYRPGINRTSEHLCKLLDSQAVMRDFTTGNAEFDELIKGLNDKRPKEDDFVDIYGRKEVERDKALVQEIEAKPWYVKERSEGATLVEAVIAYGIAKRGWLGKGAKVHLTDKFDDLTRGTDMLVELVHPESTEERKRTLGLAIDVTASADIDIIERKVTNSIQRLTKGNRSYGNPGGQLTTFKYMFKPHSDPRFDRSKRKYNHYVLALAPYQAEELSVQFCQKKETGDKSYLELEAQLKVILLLRHQAYLQLGEAMDNYCGGRIHCLWSYFNLPAKTKDEFKPLLDFVKGNLEKIKEHLNENWIEPRSGKEINNSDIFISIQKNLTAIDYLESLKDSILRDKKEAATIFSEVESGDGFSDDWGAHHLLSIERPDARSLRESLFLPRAAQGNR